MELFVMRPAVNWEAVSQEQGLLCNELLGKLMASGALTGAEMARYCESLPRLIESNSHMVGEWVAIQERGDMGSRQGEVIRVAFTRKITFQGPRGWVERTLQEYTLRPGVTDMPPAGTGRYVIAETISQVEEEPDPNIQPEWDLVEQRSRWKKRGGQPVQETTQQRGQG
jgi:hypothetical protein